MWKSLGPSGNAQASLRRFIEHRGPPVHTLKSAASHRLLSSFPTQPSFVPFFTRSARATPTNARRKWLWGLVISGGLTLYFFPRQPSLILSSVFASPELIPLQHAEAEPETETIVALNSPNEESRSLLSRMQHFVLVWVWEPILTTRRFVHLCIIFVPVILASPVILFGELQPGKKAGERSGAIWWYGFLVTSLQRAGPTFIKLAQWAASRADLFPAELCARMGKLHSEGHPHSLGHTKRVIERVFQRRFKDVFQEFDETPIGVGAIAQVYRAKLKKDVIPPSYLNPKRPRLRRSEVLNPTVAPFEPPPSVPTAAVAIKVLHPKVEKMISRDLRIMRFFASLISSFPGMEWLSLSEEVEVFGGMMAEQLDLRHEAKNLRVFEQNFSKRRAAVSFPRPLAAFTSKDILIEEYQNALPMETFLKIGGGPFDKQLAELGLDAFLNMLLLDNFIHSDLHPGNIMIKFYRPSTRFLLKNVWASITGARRPEDPLHPPLDAETGHDEEIIDRLRSLKADPPTWRAELQTLFNNGYLPEIVFLDAGLATTLNDLNRRNFLDLFRAIAEFDGYRAGQLMVARCRTPHLAIDPETFALRMQNVVLSVKRRTFSLGQIKISDILGEVLRAVREHHVKMEGDFVNTVLSVLLLEGIGRQLNPELDLFKSALPILRQLGRQMAAQESVEAVKDLSRSDLGHYLKLWVWMEARSFASSAIVDLDALIRYDWLVPNV